MRSISPNIDHFIISILLGFCISRPAHAQEYYFKNITVNDGLSQDDVNSIIQDSFGFIWIGTFDGLNRFDGVQVESFHRITANPESLPDDRISALAEDRQKRIWIGTQAGLFAYYSLLDERFVRVKSPENIGNINCFVVTQDSQVYAGTNTGIFHLKEGAEAAFELVPGTHKLGIRAGKQAVNGNLYFVGRSGAFLLKNGAINPLPLLNNRWFTALTKGADHRLIAGCYDGLYWIDEQGCRKIQQPDAPQFGEILSMETDHEGNHWIGTRSNGLYLLDPALRVKRHIKTSPSEPRGLLSNAILDIFIDRSNNLWLGNVHGLCYTNLNLIGFGSLKLQELTRPNVRSLLAEGDDVLLGISNEGLFRYHLPTEKLERIPTSANTFIYQIVKIDDTIYACSSQGLLAAKGSQQRFEKVNLSEGLESTAHSSIRCIVQDDFSRKFLGFANGIVVMEDGKFRWLREDNPALEQLSDHFVFRMFYDSAKRQLLIGTVSKGLFILQMDEKGHFFQLRKGELLDTHSKNIANTSVWSFFEAKDKTLWIGTDVGLFRRSAHSGAFEQIAVPGILDQKIMAIAESPDGHLWLSNTHALLRFHLPTNQIRNYTYEDGLISNSLTEGMQYVGDTLFFGTTNGVNFIRPLQISPQKIQPSVLISTLRVNYEVVKPGNELFGSVILAQNINAAKQLTLNHLQHNFSIEFSSTNYLKGAKNHFRYRLQGYHDNWIYTTQENKIASYANLKPGNYVFHLEVADHEGNWSGRTYTLPIAIIPALWDTPWAYAIYILISTLIVVGFAYFWFNRQRLYHQIQLDQIKINQDQLLRERQLRYFADVAHEFKTPLSLILAPFNDLMNRTLSPEKQEICMQIISRNIQRLGFLVSQLLDFDRIAEGKNILSVVEHDLRKSIIGYSKSFTWQAEHENIGLRLKLTECKGYFDPGFLEKILYNVLSNAFKHTPKGGIIEISLKVEQVQDQQLAIISVNDSGSGIPDDQKVHVFERFFHNKDRASSGIGLHLTQRLVEAHKGTISVEDSHYGGAHFKITLPISKSSYAPSEMGNDTSYPESYEAEEEQIGLEKMDEKAESILVVEDDYELRNYLKMSLQGEYSVWEATNGEQGILVAEQRLPDIIISDIMMPKMDGIEMCLHLKGNNATSHIPILFLTAKTDTEFQKKGLEAGAWDYITKPFDSEALQRKVMNILETRNKFKSYLLEHKESFEIKSHYTSFDQKLLQDIYQIIEKNLQNPDFTASELASEIGLSRMHLHRKLKTLTGETAKGLITRVKIKYAVGMFDQGCDRVQEAMHAVGMNNYANFNSNFKKIMHMTATDYLSNLKNRQ